MNQGESIDAALLDRYLAGESTPAEADIVSRWASERPERQQFLAALAHPSGAFHDGQTLATWDAEAARRRWQAQVRLETHSPTHSPRLSRAWPWGVGGGGEWRLATSGVGARAARRQSVIAAMVLVALGAGLAVGSLRHRASTASPGREYATAAGQRLSVTLIDGTQMTLAPASRVRLVSARDAALEGEAYFAVVHDAAHPFAVRMHGVVVRDVGTAFDIRAYPEDKSAWVAVAEGTVAIAAPAVGAVRERPVRAGDVATIGPSSVVLEHGVDVAALTAWRQGELVFHDMPLADVAREIGRTFDLRVTIADSDLADRLITARFGNESADEVLDEVTRTVRARYERTGNQVTIRRRTGPIRSDQERATP